jgi:RPA family protein
MALERSIAYKVRIKDITGGEFIKGSERFEPNLLVTPLGEEVSRVRVLATVVSKFISEDEKFGALTLDDGTDTIAARAFRGDVELIEKVEEGDTVDVVGKVKEYDGEKYINVESVWVIKDPNWELVRKLELALKLHGLGGEKETETERVLEEGEEREVADPKMIVLNLIEELDEGEGVKYITLLNESKLDDEKLEEVLGELMNDGEIYEPKIGRFKRV